MAATFKTPDFCRPFVKMHGLGNHFIIVDGREEPYRPDAQTIARLCDLHTGIGADQLVVIEPPRSDDAYAFMRLYNVDGREVGACGNATRCVAWLLLEESTSDRIGVETLAGVLDCQRRGEARVACDLGPVRTGWRDVPLAEEADTSDLEFPALGLRGGTAVNVGNPHVVFFVDDVSALDAEELGAALQADPLFPEQVNAGFAEVTGPASIRLVVYERGAGLTRACGTGASAAAWAAIRRGLTDAGEVEVSLPGGIVTIAITANDHAVMTGPVAFAFRGEL